MAVLPDRVDRSSERHAANRRSMLARLGKLLARERIGARHAWDDADRIFEPVYLSDDAQEGPRAFVERRPPRWTGRSHGMEAT